VGRRGGASPGPWVPGQAAWLQGLSLAWTGRTSPRPWRAGGCWRCRWMRRREP